MNYTYPNLLAVRAIKSGTTAAYDSLATAPDVTLSAIKEPNHFCFDLHRHLDFKLTRSIHHFAGIHWITDRERNLELFRSARTRRRDQAFAGRCAVVARCPHNPREMFHEC
jgi:hypothetical protein